MRKFMTFFFSAILAVSTFVTPAKAETADTYAVTFGATVTDAGQYVDRMTIDFGDVLSVAGVTEETFTVHMTSTVDYGSLKGQPYPYYNAENPLPVVKTEVNGSKVNVYFNQAAAPTLTWLGEGRNYPAILSFTIEQNAPITITTRDGRALEVNGTYTCDATSYKDLECAEVEAYEDVQDEINYQFHKGTNDKLIVFFHGNGEGDFPVKDTNNNIAQILANRGGAAWVSEAQEVFGDASVMCFQAPNMWYFAVKDNLLEPCYNEIMEVVEENGINPDEIYLSGASAGGFMCTRMIIAYPYLFKAAMVNCPALDAANARSGSDDAIPTDDELKQLLNARTAIWLVQGETDSSVSPELCSKRIWSFLSEGQEVTTSKHDGYLGIASGYTTYETADGKYKMSLYETFDLGEITGISGDVRQGGKLKFAEDYDMNGEYEEVKYSDHWCWIYTLRNNPEDAEGTHIWNWALAYNAVTLEGTQKVVIDGDDWGCGVVKTIIKLSDKVTADSIDVADFRVYESKQATNWTTFEVGVFDYDREVLDAYTCDENGEKAEGASEYIALDLYVSPNDGSPFIYSLASGRNSWCDPYELHIGLIGSLAKEDGTVVGALNIDPAINFDEQINPDLEKFDITHKFTASDGTVYSYADYTGALADDDHKNPLLIWLNGGGEGGTDPSIVLLANEVTEFAGDVFQNALDGAYVLVPQVPTYWLEGYDWQGEDPDVAGESIYNESVMELIKAYVDANDDIDADRIYVTGCSNGGYMTLNLAILNPDYFAAALPICEGYRDEDVTDEMLEGIKDLPLWFTFAANDTTLVPEIYCRPTIERLKDLGASNLHVSEFEDVHDTSGRFDSEDGTPYQYSGHWSWIYFDNNECYDEDGLNCLEWLARQRRSNGTLTVNVVGDDWGPAVDKAIIILDEPVKAADLKAEDISVTEIKEAFNWGTFQIYTAETEREVLDVYLSDQEGNKVEDEEGYIVTVEMYVSPSVGSPFFYDLFTGFNRWVNQYELTVVGDGISVHQAIDFHDTYMWQSEPADSFQKSTYYAQDGTPIVYGEYIPEKDGLKPLVIWLHGAGEGTNKGANDNYIDLLGNEVTALASDEFQSLFENGAYVVTPQAPTMWMDDGTGAYQNGDKGSCYEYALFSFIDDYAWSHADIDHDRIIIGGCSNGGYMTMEITMKHPGYFAKAYPICEAFQDQYITDEMIEAVKEGGTKYWFVYALTDTTVNPDICEKPTIERFKAAGIETHVTEWEKVEDLTGRFTDEAGNPYEYNGHWSWIYFDNNACTEGDLNCWNWLADDSYTGFRYEYGEYYWYENGKKQGVYGDEKNIWDTQYDQIERGREIYDPQTDAWYWLDANNGGAVAMNKEVWMPYIFQGEDPATEGKWVRYNEYGQMIKGWYANDNGVYYYDLITGAMLKGTHEINGKTCTFDGLTGILTEMK